MAGLLILLFPEVERPVNYEARASPSTLLNALKAVLDGTLTKLQVRTSRLYDYMDPSKVCHGSTLYCNARLKLLQLAAGLILQ